MFGLHIFQAKRVKITSSEKEPLEVNTLKLFRKYLSTKSPLKRYGFDSLGFPLILKMLRRS